MFRALDLRKEWLAALAVFGLVNVLLLIVNIIDINWLWFGFVPEPNFDLAQFVHEGTYVLIFSILLAMGIVLCSSGAILISTVPACPGFARELPFGCCKMQCWPGRWGLRNYYYILHSGLAYKRIGVCFFCC